MTAAFFLAGVLCGLSIAWTWYVVAHWWKDHRPERVELDETWVRFQQVADHHEPSWLITDTGRRIPPPRQAEQRRVL